MQYVKDKRKFEGLNIIQVGDVVSFGVVTWKLWHRGALHRFYNVNLRRFQWSDELSLLPDSYGGRSLLDVAGELIDVPPFRVELDETFRVTEILPKRYSTPPTGMNTQDGGSYSSWEYRAVSQRRPHVTAIFHFESMFVTSLEAVFLHDDGDTYEDKLRCIRSLVEERVHTKHPEIERLLRNGELHV